MGLAQLLLDLGHSRQHRQHSAHPAHPPDLAQLTGEIVEIKSTFLQLGGELFGLLLIDGLGRFLDEAHDIAHAEDASGDPLGVERLDRLDPLAEPDQHDRLAGDRAHRERRTAPRIAVDPGQDDRTDAGAFAKSLGDVDRILAGHRVGDEQGLVRICRLAHRCDLEHQLLVDVEPAGGVEDDGVVALRPSGVQGPLGDRHRPLAGHNRQRSHTDLAAQHGELLLCRRPLHVERGEQDPLALAALQAMGDLGRGRRLARALQPDQHDHDRGRGVEIDPLHPRAVEPTAEHLDEVVVDDLDDHLRWRH